MKKINFYLIIFSVFLTSCQSVKDGLSGRKSDNSDEFLVKKKNPLVMPPKFMELPEPEEETFDKETAAIEETNDIKSILNLEKNSSVNSKQQDSTEDFVLKQLKDK